MQTRKTSNTDTLTEQVNSLFQVNARFYTLRKNQKKTDVSRDDKKGKFVWNVLFIWGLVNTKISVQGIFTSLTDEPTNANFLEISRKGAVLWNRYPL